MFLILLKYVFIIMDNLKTFFLGDNSNNGEKIIFFKALVGVISN
jgi:hypothetical protein